MKYLLAPAAIALAIGTVSVPAKAHVVEEVTYRDRNNTITISTKKENAASETLLALGGQADTRLREADIFFCDGGPGSPISDELLIFGNSGPTNQSVEVDLFSDFPTLRTGTCRGTMPVIPGKKKQPSKVIFVDERKCHGRCEVGQFFGLDDDAVTVLSK